MGDVNFYMKCITWAEQLFETYVAIYKEHFHNVSNMANDTLLYAFLTVVRSLFRSVECSSPTHHICTSTIYIYKVYLWLEASTTFRTYIKHCITSVRNDATLAAILPTKLCFGDSQCCAHIGKGLRAFRKWKYWKLSLKS